MKVYGSFINGSAYYPIRYALTRTLGSVMVIAYNATYPDNLKYSKIPIGTY